MNDGLPDEPDNPDSGHSGDPSDSSTPAGRPPRRVGRHSAGATAARDAAHDPAVGGTPADADPSAAPEPGTTPVDATTDADRPGTDAAGDPDGAADRDGDGAAASPGRRFGLRRKRKDPSRPKRKAPWWELPALIILAILIAIGVKSFVIQPFYIPSASMEHTLHGCPGCEGDRILVNKTIYDFRDPEPGDIVVFNAPKGWDDEPTSKPPGNPVLRVIRGFGQLIGFVPPDGEVLVKRVIASGGQTVKGDAQGRVWVSKDGPHGHFRLLNEPYVYINKSEGGLFDFGPVTVPKGRLWVMGDHRSNSADSRYHCGTAQSEDPQAAATKCDPVTSTVPDGKVIGKAIVIAWPPSRWTTLGTPATFESAAAVAVTPNGLPLVSILPIYLVRRRIRRRRN